MASSSTKAASSQPSVQPSSTLIGALHHKLCDPSIVAEFEQCRSPHVTQRLISPRWILKSIAADEADDDKGAGSISSRDKSTETSETNHNHHDNAQEPKSNNDEPKFNTVPKRTYLDIRMEQNTIFANDQCLRCQKKLAALSSTSPKSVEAININRTQIKKVIDSIRNHLKEGLSACPNHEGLVQVESEVQVWLDRLNGVAVVANGFNKSDSAALDTVAVTVAGANERRANHETIIDLSKPDTQQNIVVKRKGGDGRAQAAIDDALVEKMFLQGDQHNGGNTDSNNNDDAVDTNNDLKWVPPAASRVDESADHHMRREEYPSDSDSYHDRKRSRHHGRRRSLYESRSRSRSVERREERRKGERRRRRHADRKRKKRRRRSRSLSRGSLSPTAPFPSRSTSRDRSERRHRRDHHHRHKRGHKSKSHRKERRKSSKRHRSRREQSQSASPSSRPSVPGGDDFNRRFEPPRLSQSVQHERDGERPMQREGIEGGSVEPQLNESEISREITDKSAIEQMEIEANHRT